MAINLYDLEKIIQLLYKKDDDAFEELKLKLNEKGMKICAAHLMTQSKSFCTVEVNKKHTTVPYLSLIAADNTSYQQLIGEPQRVGLIQEDIKEEIISLWKNICIQYQFSYDEYYHQKMYIGVENAETLIYTYIARTQKESIEKLIYDYLKVKPRSLYASSEPGLNIVFYEDDYYSYEIEKQQPLIEQKIKIWTSLKAKELVGRNADNILDIQFYHPPNVAL